MSAATFPSFCLILCFLVCSSGAQKIIEAELGQNMVVLPCKAPNNINISNIAVNWSRPGLDPEYVLFYRDGHIDPNQHPSYENRVDLQDKEMKDGDVSMILKDVTMEDTGIYRCWVLEKRNKYPINNITLEVHPSGEKFQGGKGRIIGDEGNKIGGDISRGRPGAVVGVILPLLVVLASFGFLMYKRHMKKNPNLPVPPDEPVAEQMSTVPEHHQNQVQLV